jgi:DNA-binding SARP family transcriptional activator
MSLTIRLFGHLEVTHNSTPIARRLEPRAQRLLVYLLTHLEARLTRETVAFILWPDNLEKEALGRFRRALNELRAALPHTPQVEWIIAARNELRWNSRAPYWLDIEEFEKRVRQVSPAGLHDAVALYRGDLLPEMDDEWLAVEREHLRQMQIDALHQLVSHHRALSEYQAAVDLAQQILVLDPLAESAYRELISLHYLADDRASALAEYEHLRSTLRDELGAEPMAETQALAAIITQGAPLPRADVVTPGPTPSPAAVQVLPKAIGREIEMAELGALWESAAMGHGRLIIISGEAGVGKSHLALTFGNAARNRAGLMLVGHCYEFERALPYQAIIESLRSATNLLRHVDLAPSHRAELARLAPDLVGAAGSPLVGGAAQEGDLRDQLFEALLQAFLALARHQPVLLLLEDVHWASGSTLDWLTYIALRLGESPLLVTITHRLGEVTAEHALARLRRRFARLGAIASLSLTPLSRAAHRELVAVLSGLAEKRANAVADRLFAETAGNPFFLQELVRALIEGGQIIMRDGRWSGSFVASAPEAVVPLPDALRETINARVQRLVETSQNFLKAAAVAGRVFEFPIIHRAAGWSEELALAALEDVLAREFIRRSEAEGTFAFVHHLVQEAIYAHMNDPRRMYWHRRIAEATAALRPGDFESLAYHFAAAGERVQAIEYSCRAARRAQTVYAYEEAAKYLNTALTLLKPGEQPETRLALLEELADAHSLIGEGARAIREYQEVLNLWETLRHADKMLAIRLHRKIVQSISQMKLQADFERFEAALQVSTASWANLATWLKLMEGEPPHPEMVRLHTALSLDAWITRSSPDWDAAERYARAAVDMAELLDEPVALSAALKALVNVYYGRGLLRERVEVSLRRLALSRDPRFADLRERVDILLEAGDALVDVGEFAQAIPYLLEAERLASQIQVLDQQANAINLQAKSWFRLDRWDDVLKIEERWRVLQRRYPRKRVGPFCFEAALSSSAYALRGDLEQARALRDESHAIMVAVSGPPEEWQRNQYY